MATVANQKVVIIHKRNLDANFLQLSKDDMYTAANELSGAGFKVYLYLAANANGFELALSKTAIETAMKVSKSSYYNALKELEGKGYLVNEHGNVYSFHEQPRTFQKSDSGGKTCVEQVKSIAEFRQSSPKNRQQFPEIGQRSPKNDIEINNIHKTDRIDNCSAYGGRNEEGYSIVDEQYWYRR